MKRRNFLMNAGTMAAMSALPLTFSSFSAPAMEADDYKALVCVFLFGGMDNHDTVIPYDNASYNAWAGIRSSLVSQHNGGRDQANLLELSPDNASTFDGRSFALPPQMTGLRQLFQDGDLAIVGNVGPLVQPVSVSDFEEQVVPLPPRLFSHNDQQAVWMSSTPEGAQFGWGGFFADAVLELNTDATFTGITSGGSDLFLTGREAFPYQVGVSGAANIWLLDALEGRLGEMVTDHARAAGFTGTDLVSRDIAGALQSSYDANLAYSAALAGAPTLATEFPAGPLGAQLGAVARTISARGSLGARRQIFIVSMGGFDTHDAQATSLPGLHAGMDGALSAFHAALVEMGLNDAVTTFTASDFGRTLAINGDGTDHGWGAHHFVMGGAVNGRNIYGTLPEPVFGHDQDAGGGRLIPTVSVEQFAAPLGQWLGLDETQLATALPNLANFSAPMLPIV